MQELAGFVSISGWGAVPNTGENMLSKIQDALSLAPSGCTLYFPPGTYTCTGTSGLVCERPINIYAWGALLQYQASFSGTAFRFGRNAAPGAQMSNCCVAGLTVLRDTSDDPPRKGIGFDWLSLRGVKVDTCRGFAFEIAHLVRADPSSSGACENISFFNASSVTSSRGVVIEGLSRQISIVGARTHLPPGIAQVAMQIISTSGSYGTAIPEAIGLYGGTLEGEWPRKIYCEGKDNLWLASRYERPKIDPPDVEFVYSGSAQARNNVLLDGMYLGYPPILASGTLLPLPLTTGRITASGGWQDLDPWAPYSNAMVPHACAIPSTIYGNGADGDGMVTEADHVIVEAVRAQALPASLLPKVLEGWERSKYPAFEPRTAWSLYNAFTEVAKSRSPRAQIEDTLRLTTVFRRVLALDPG